MKFLSLLAGLALLPASLNAADFFPVCMYGIGQPAELKVLKDGGFNCFQTYEPSPEKLAGLAAEAETLGLKMVASPEKVMGSPLAAAAKSWPMLAWYLYDEPEIHRFSPESLLALDKRVKDWSPRQRTAFVMGEGLAALTYGAAADALMVDWYPVPHLKLESLGQQVTLTRQGALALDKARPDKPVWAVLQAFNWLEYPQRRAKRIGRFPTAEEVRFMTYLSLARGAKGIFYFKYSDAAASPERWNIFTDLAAEVQQLGPLLAKAKPGARPAGLDPALDITVFRRWGRKHMIILNPSYANVPLNAEALKGWRPLFEKKRYLEELLPGGKNLYLPPYRALVLED
jgi:hypothetical protein